MAASGRPVDIAGNNIFQADGALLTVFCLRRQAARVLPGFLSDYNKLFVQHPARGKFSTTSSIRFSDILYLAARHREFSICTRSEPPPLAVPSGIPRKPRFVNLSGPVE